ncbi:MAG: MFS transporter [Alphaproteobacteria bacterium]
MFFSSGKTKRRFNINFALFCSSDKSVNLLNTHYAFLYMAWQMLCMFSMVFLYKAGVPLPFVFLTSAGIFVFRFLFRPLSLILINKIGCKKTLIIGSMVLCLPPLAIIPVTGLNQWLYIYIGINTVADCLYWLSYHTFFANSGRIEERGTALGIREGLSKIATIVGPLLSGSLLTIYGPKVAFGITSFLTFLASIPLFLLPDVKMKKLTRKEKKGVSKFGMKIFIVWGFMQTVTAWPIILFKLFGENFQIYGWLLSLLGFFMAVMSFVLGRFIDKGKGKSIYRISIALIIITNLGRALFAYDYTTVIAFDILYSISFCFFTPAGMTAVYNVSKTTSNPLYFQFYAEAGWDIGSVLALICCAAMAFLGINLRYSLALSAFGAILTGIGLFFYYEKPSKPVEDSEAKAA